MLPSEIETYLLRVLAREIADLKSGETTGGGARCPACNERGLRYTISRDGATVALYASHQAPQGCGLRFQKPEPGDGLALSGRT